MKVIVRSVIILNLQKYRKEISAVVVALTIVYCTIIYRSIRPNAIALYKNGDIICTLDNNEQYLEVKDSLVNSLKERFKSFDFKDDFKIKKIRVEKASINTPEDAKELLLKNLDVLVEAVSFIIDGKEMAVIDSQEIGEKVIRGLTDYYINKSGLKNIKNIKVLNQVTYVKNKVPINKVLEDIIVTQDIISKNIDNSIFKASFTGSKYENQKISPATSTIWTNDYVIGTSVTKQTGKDGIKEVEKQITMENGTEKKSSIVSTKVIQKSIDKIVAIGTKNPILAGIAFLSTPSRGGITSYFTYRWGKMHEGIDIGAATGTPIYASAEGTVTGASYDSGYGNLVKINHGSGIESLYGHTSKMVVSVGQKVKRGQLIAYVGSTGRSTGPHLHFEVRLNGNPVNPLKYLR